MAEPVVVTSPEVAYQRIPPVRAMDLIEAALRDERAARIVPVTLALEDGTAFRIVAGATAGTAVVRFGAAGRFWATGRAHLKHWAAVFDQDSGDLVALVRFPLTGLRVAATLGVAARRLVDGPVPVAMIGSGNYSYGVLEALHLGTGIASLTVVSRTPAHAQVLADRVAAELAVPATTAPDVATAVAAARLVVVGTDSTEPVLSAGWLRGDQLVLSYGQPSELDPSVYLAADRLAASDVDLELASGTARSHPMAGPDGRPRRRFAPLAELLPAGPAGAGGLVVVRDGGGGVGDAALAAAVAADMAASPP